MPALLIFAAVATFTSVTVAAFAAGLYQAYEQRRQAKKAARHARDAYNAALQDRLVMVELTPNAPRTLALGRVRGVEGLRRRWASGTNDEKLTLIVSFAGHEIDAFETFYFDDVALTLDGSGYVQTAPWFKGTNTSAEHYITLNGSGGGSYTIPGTLVTGSVTAICATDDGTRAVSVSMAGNVATLSGGVASSACTIQWQASSGTSMARIRSYRGTAAQNVGAALAAEYPGKISAADKFAGIALAVVDLTYDADVFPQGYPQLTAVFRGAKVLDPRTATTAWSQNPALLAYHYARHINGWAVPVGDIATADINAAANECDISTVYTLRMPDTSTTTVTLPRYRCGIVISTAADPRASMDEIMETMAGRWGWAGGTLRMRAGMCNATAFELDESWVAQRLGSDGQLVDSSVVRITNGTPREQRWNRVTGVCVDPSQRYQVLPFPSVADATDIAAAGREIVLDVEYQGVNHIAHAQHLAAVAIREGQAGLRMQFACNLRAYRCELFDVGEITLPRYGFSAKTAEVTGWRWHPEQGVQLTMAEITPAIFDTAELNGRDPAPNSDLPLITTVEDILGLAVASGGDTLTDGSLLTRVDVTWTAVTSDAVRRGGHIEVQYALADETLPTTDWPSHREQGDVAHAIIAGLKQRRPYIFRARAVTALGVRGKWSTQVLHYVAQRSRMFRVVATGAADTQTPAAAALYDGDTATQLRGAARSYNLARIRRSDAAIVYSASYDLLANPGNSVNSLVTAIADQLAPMGSTRAAATVYASGDAWYVRPTTAHSTTRDGTSYARAWGTFDEIDWGDVAPGDSLWVCGAFDDEEMTVGASGTVGNPIDIRLDHPTDPGIIYNSHVIASGDWTGPDGNGEYWLGSLDSPDLILYEDGERLIGCSKPSKNAIKVTAVDIGADTITIAFERPFVTGALIVIPIGGGATALPAPLARFTAYYCIRVSDQVCKLATSYANAIAGTAINLTAAGDGNTWKLFFTNTTTHQDPIIGSLGAGQYQWDGVAQRIYYKPSSGTPASHVLRISTERTSTTGACIYMSAKTDIRVFGGGEYGGLFGVAPRGKVGQCHTNAIQTVNDCERITIDGIEISGCRSGVGFVGGINLTVRNSRIRDCGWHGAGGESGDTPERLLLLERNWLSDIATKNDYGDGQGLVANRYNDDSIIRRNYLQRVGRNHDYLNNGNVVMDNSDNVWCYRNLLDDCVGSGFIFSAGVEPIVTGGKVYSNIVSRHNHRLSYAGDHRTRSAFVFMSIPSNDGIISAPEVCGNLVCNSTWPLRTTFGSTDFTGALTMRPANTLTGGVQGAIVKRNAFINFEIGAVYAVNIVGVGTPVPTYTFDYNLYAGIASEFYSQRRTGYSDTLYDSTHVIGVSAGYWTNDTGQDAHSLQLAAAGAFASPAPTQAMLDFIKQDDAFDTLAAPTLASVGQFPLAGGANATAATALATALDATGNDHIVSLSTLTDARTGRLNATLLAAMYRCGASPAVYGSPGVLHGSAYAMVGIGQCGQANAYEVYSGSVSNDTNAWVDVAFMLARGNLVVTGSSAKPRTLVDYGAGGLAYLGSVDTDTIDQHAVSELVEMTDAGPIAAFPTGTGSPANWTETARIYVGPYNEDAQLLIYYDAQCNMQVDAGFPSPYANAFAQLENSISGYGPQAQSDQWFDHDPHAALMSVNTSVFLRAGDVVWVRSIGLAYAGAPPSSVCEWVNVSLRAVVLKR